MSLSTVPSVDCFFYLLLLIALRRSFVLTVLLLLHLLRMPPVVPFVVPILEAVAAHYELPPPLYTCEVDGDGYVLAGVDVEVPRDGVVMMAQRRKNWSHACLDFADAYEQAALQAIKFLQGLYGFVVRDYKYECVVVYMNCGNAAVAIVASVVRYAAYLERTPACRHSSATDSYVSVSCAQPQPPPNLALLYSRLLASVCSI